MKSESLEQIEFVCWFRRTHPNVLIFSIPNGGVRSPSQSLKMKNEGVVKGIPDLFIPAWLCWVEMKRTKGGTTSPEQKAMHLYLRSIGHTVIIGNGFEDAKARCLVVP